MENSSVWLIALLCIFISPQYFVAARDDVYAEELVLKRLASQNMAAQFRFTTTTTKLGEIERRVH